MTMDTDLQQFLALDIPTGVADHVGFLEISGVAHKETINSRIYAYFLDGSVDENISSIFIAALLKLINEKTEKWQNSNDPLFVSFSCETETSTAKGNRIDLLIKDEESGKAIIIENKIYHHLANDLLDYWNHAKMDAENKVGILLTLSRHAIPSEVEGKFINITHKEWIDEILKMGLPAKLNTNSYVYLNDFFSTIEQLTKSEHMNQQAEFYFNYANRVNKAMDTHREALNFVIDQLKIVAEDLGWTLYGKNDSWRDIWNEVNQKQAYYLIDIGDLFTDKKEIKVTLVLFRDAIAKEDIIRQALEGNEAFNKLDDTASHHSFVYLKAKTYQLSLKELKELATSLSGKLKGDFKPVMDIVLKTIETA